MSEPIGDDSRIVRVESVVAAEIDDEVVILNIESGYFYQLNRVGARIWNALETPATLGLLSARMQNMFDVTAETCRNDVVEFVQQMRASGIVIIHPAD
jgi:hypothetical protein